MVHVSGRVAVSRTVSRSRTKELPSVGAVNVQVLLYTRSRDMAAARVDGPFPMPATLTYLGAERTVATGLGDRLGRWVPLFALAALWGNGTEVALRWAPAWNKLNRKIRGDAMAAIECLQFPAYVRRVPTAPSCSTVKECEKEYSRLPSTARTNRVTIDPHIPMRTGLRKGPEGKGTKPSHQASFDRVPAILWWRWKEQGLLPAWGSELEQFLAACRRAALDVRCRPQ